MVTIPSTEENKNDTFWIWTTKQFELFYFGCVLLRKKKLFLWKKQSKTSQF